MKTLKSAALTAMASLGLICSFSLTAPRTQACTRVVYIGDDGYAITGRNLDWKEDIATNLYVYPQGIVRSGYDVKDSTLTWTSRYGSVIAVSYDMGTSEGMNEAGL
ncbi:MAG: linear amide C-N hydrolase, partial [Bacteroidales bacterium]|nr:linear amide C-N hydrolase [Bacteroidales bacterium]